jgi:hypothetical protein
MAFQIKDDLFDYTQRKLLGNQLVLIGTENDFAVNPCFKYLYLKKNHG